MECTPSSNSRRKVRIIRSAFFRSLRASPSSSSGNSRGKVRSILFAFFPELTRFSTKFVILFAFSRSSRASSSSASCNRSLKLDSSVRIASRPSNTPHTERCVQSGEQRRYLVRKAVAIWKLCGSLLTFFHVDKFCGCFLGGFAFRVWTRCCLSWQPRAEQVIREPREIWMWTRRALACLAAYPSPCGLGGTFLGNPKSPRCLRYGRAGNFLGNPIPRASEYHEAFYCILAPRCLSRAGSNVFSRASSRAKCFNFTIHAKLHDYRHIYRAHQQFSAACGLPENKCETCGALQRIANNFDEIALVIKNGMQGQR